MRLPQQILYSPFFSFETLEELTTALGDAVEPAEIGEIARLAAAGLPPITSHHALAVMIGINPGLAWSLENRTHKYYRHFQIPKGKSFRSIQAPKIALKIIQKWISVHIQRKYEAPDHVFGFVAGRSHIDAAQMHVGADWVTSIDIKDFFQSTPRNLIFQSLVEIGYSTYSASIISNLSCLGGFLSQGSPCSPIFSNMCFQHLDREILALSVGHQITVSRYVDDIVFSGQGHPPENLISEIRDIMSRSPWKIAEEKVEQVAKPRRLKVHGLLVHGDNIRLTKGYRNRIRAIEYLMRMERIPKDRILSAKGHITYAAQVAKRSRDETP